MTYIVRKKGGRGQRPCLLTVLDLFGGISSAICPGPSLYSGAGLGAINCTHGPSHSWLMHGKASGLWVAHHCQDDNLMPGLVDHFTTSQEFWNWETKWAWSDTEAGPPMRGARAAAEACEEAERGACQYERCVSNQERPRTLEKGSERGKDLGPTRPSAFSWVSICLAYTPTFWKISNVKMNIYSNKCP